LPLLGEESVVGGGLSPVHTFPVVGVTGGALVNFDNVLGVAGHSLVAHGVGIGEVEGCAVAHVALLAF